MPIYYTTVNRPTLEAATPEEAAQKSVSDPLGPDDTVYVKEIPAEGSMHYTPGALHNVGGMAPVPDETYMGPDLIPTKMVGVTFR